MELSKRRLSGVCVRSVDVPSPSLQTGCAGSRRSLLAHQLLYPRHVRVCAGSVADGAAGGAAVDVSVDVGRVQTDGIVEIGQGVNVVLLPEIGVPARVVGQIGRASCRERV